MNQHKYPITSALRRLRQLDIPHEVFMYRYEEHGGTRVSSRELNVPEHEVIKTLIMETDAHIPLVVLMHGDREVSTKELARILGVKSVKPCEPKDANKYSGYIVGGVSPFGTKRAMKTYIQESILTLKRIFINAGNRGLLVRMDPADLGRALDAVYVNVAQSENN